MTAAASPRPPGLHRDPRFRRWIDGDGYPPHQHYAFNGGDPKRLFRHLWGGAALPSPANIKRAARAWELAHGKALKFTERQWMEVAKRLAATRGTYAGGAHALSRSRRAFGWRRYYSDDGESICWEWESGFGPHGEWGHPPPYPLNPGLGVEAHDAHCYWLTLWGRANTLRSFLYDLVTRWAEAQVKPKYGQRVTVRFDRWDFLLVALTNRNDYAWWSALSGPDEKVPELVWTGSK